MIDFEYDNLFKIKEPHGLTPLMFEAFHGRISETLERIHSRQQGFYRVVDDETAIETIERFAESFQGKFKTIVVLGIGGSALGTLCLHQSLMPFFKYGSPRFHILDNIDPELLHALRQKITLADTLFIVASKSGWTVETLAQYFYFREEVIQSGHALEDHFVFITDPENGLLRKIAQEHPTLKTFAVPQNVGGRFSVLTATGLLPAALMGLDLRALLQGARTMRERFLNPSWNENLPFQLATIQYLLGQQGKIINVLMPYSERLIRFADWYRQLLSESIGKAINERGEPVHVGLTPINALGVTDQHSQLQLYNEGPNDKFFIFVSVKDQGPEIAIPNPYPHESTFNFLKGVSFNRLIHTELHGTAQSLTENDRPNMTLNLDRVDATHLGALFMLFQCATAFLGEFYGIDAFNQPGVERSKQLTKELLLS